LRVTDNGRGFEVPTDQNGSIQTGRGGNGLKNMRQRLTAIGGECRISSRIGAGTVVTLRVRPGKKSGVGS